MAVESSEPASESAFWLWDCATKGYGEDKAAKEISIYVSIKGFQSITKTNVFKSGLFEGVLRGAGALTTCSLCYMCQ